MKTNYFGNNLPQKKSPYEGVGEAPIDNQLTLEELIKKEDLGFKVKKVLIEQEQSGGCII